MRFSRRGDFDIVTRISGPLHHYLGLRLHRDRVDSLPDLTVEDLSIPSPHQPHGTPPDESRLIAEVAEGLKAANDRLGTRYAVDGMRYCSADPYLSGIYRILTQELVEHVSRGGHSSTPPGIGEGPDRRDACESIDRIADESFLEYGAREASDPRR